MANMDPCLAAGPFGYPSGLLYQTADGWKGTFAPEGDLFRKVWQK